ncbi:MAG: pullulanase-type alpha-1,6-glucosidase [Balneolaceae bacterium]
MKNLSLLFLALLIISCSKQKNLVAEPEENKETAQIEISGAAAHWVSADHLIWDSDNEAVSWKLFFSRDASLTVTKTGVSGGRNFTLQPGEVLPNQLSDKFRHISDRPVYSLSEHTDSIKRALKGQLVAVAFDAEGEPMEATKVQIHGVLDDIFTYDGNLGPVYEEDSIELKLWAPTAQTVKLSLYDDQKNLVEVVDPVDTSPENGVYRFEGPTGWDELYYLYNINVYHHETGEIQQFEVTDPYSVSLSTDSKQSQFINLTHENLKPDGWDERIKPLPAPADISLYEVHMRDFSIGDSTVPEEHRGTYMAFSHNGQNGRELSDGMNHLKQLSEAGLTHLHLLPVNDIASIYENRNQRVALDDPFERICEIADIPGLSEDCEKYGTTPVRDVFRQLAKDDPVTKEIQRIYAERSDEGYHGLARHDGFNWGYDPFHFNVPEGSYSTQPNGPNRILEFRNMVQSLDEIGLNIVVDVVYNHTHATGGSRFSVLDKIVPGYYQRLNTDTGQVETSTCCSNTAAEFAMMEKLIVDSVKLWAKQYKIDSFRFDLMGHHPKYVMENLQDALAELTPEKDGVDGKNIYIYGEGWNFGEVADDRIFEQATQFNMGGTGIGNFNDRSRDAIRGGFYSWTGREQGFANGRYLYPNEAVTAGMDDEKPALLDQADRIRVGMTGNLATYPYINKNGEQVDGSNDYIGYALNPVESVNYIDKHDNETLWDNTQTKLPLEMEMENRVRVHLLSTAFINFGLGVPFHQLGTDILRSKSMDRNSYDSGDWYNTIDYTLESSNWAIGLPPRWDNEENWEAQAKFMSNPNVNIRKEHMEFANHIFREQLMIRYSTPLLRLGDAEQVRKRVGFHNTGPEQMPGVIAMTISDGSCTNKDLDPDIDGLLIIFNADQESKEIDLGITGLKLHPILQEGIDSVVQSASVQNGLITIPPITAAIFVKPQSGGQGEFLCNPVIE